MFIILFSSWDFLLSDFFLGGLGLFDSSSSSSASIKFILKSPSSESSSFFVSFGIAPLRNEGDK